MAKVLGKLNPKTVSGALPPGHYSDGGSLYLVVKKGGARAWTFIYRWKGRELEKGFGAVRNVSLAYARERATAARAKIAAGQDPFLIEEDSGRAPMRSSGPSLLASRTKSTSPSGK